VNKEESEDDSAVDLNSHIEIFHAIYSQIIGTQNEHHFLSILRHLLELEESNCSNEKLWELIEKLVCRATVFNKEETCLHTLERYADEKLKSLKIADDVNSKIKNEPVQPASALAPPLPPPPPPPPPLPPCFNLKLKNKNEEEESKTINEIKIKIKKNNSIDNLKTNYEFKIDLPQFCVPKPTHKMKQISWTKIHSNRILGKENIWTKFKHQNDEEHNQPSLSLPPEETNFFNEIEEFFKVGDNALMPETTTLICGFKDNNLIKDLKETKNWHSSEKVNCLCFFIAVYSLKSGFN
jgi:hypothetical protein